MAYCASRFHTVRRGDPRGRASARSGVGGSNPIRIQSMTTSDTQDVPATVRQSVALAEVGCEIVRVTAPNVQAARCLREIRSGLTAAGWGSIPLVADIHFLPQAAMEAVEHVEKVRVNPGNYADKKRFAVRDYSDADYGRELQRLHDAFSPLVIRSRRAWPVDAHRHEPRFAQRPDHEPLRRHAARDGRERARIPAHRGSPTASGTSSFR